MIWSDGLTFGVKNEADPLGDAAHVDADDQSNFTRCKKLRRLSVLLAMVASVDAGVVPAAEAVASWLRTLLLPLLLLLFLVLQ
jgi:hypothetical protein